MTPRTLSAIGGRNKLDFVQFWQLSCALHGDYRMAIETAPAFTPSRPEAV